MKFRISERQPKVTALDTVKILDGWMRDDDIARLYEGLKDIPNPAPPATFFFEIDQMQRAPRECVTDLRQYYGDLAELIVDHMRRLLDALPASALDGATVLEPWFRSTREPASAVYLHMDHADRDENAASDMRFPMWATVFHVGPQTGIVGGETSVCLDWPLPELIQQRAFEMLDPEALRRASGDNWLDVPRRQNRLLVFRGRLAHYVARVQESSPESPRLTLLVNAWDELPLPRTMLRGCSVYTPEEFRVVTKLTPPALGALAQLLTHLTPSELALIAPRFGAQP